MTTAPEPTPLHSGLQVRVTPDRTCVPAGPSVVPVHLLVEVVAPPAPANNRAPLDLMVVLDRSGSMSGRPLQAVTEATAALLRLAGADDRIGVVSFDSAAATVLPLDHHVSETAAETVRRIRSGGNTNLSAGWLKALEALTLNTRPGAVRRILVLTDGRVNGGVTDTDALATMVAGGTAQQITTSLIGFSDHFDESLLSVLADAGRGNDYWCADSDQAMGVFTTEFAGLASVVAQNVTVTVGPDPATVGRVGVLHQFPTVTLPDGSTEIALGDAYGDETRRVVVALELSGRATEGPSVLGSVTVRWASVEDGVALQSVTIPLTTTVVPDDGRPVDLDPVVTEHVVRLRADESRRAARDAWAHGDNDSARMHMVNSVALLGSHDGIAPDELTMASRELQEFEHGTFDVRSAKRMHSGLRARSKGRMLRFETELGTGAPDPDLDDPNA